MNLYFNILYEEKDEAKELDAKWNPKREKYLDFSEWLFRYFSRVGEPPIARISGDI